jgi:ubiquinone/menaquinone biosynthesis C-methylase UbiE
MMKRTAVTTKSKTQTPDSPRRKSLGRRSPLQRDAANDGGPPETPGADSEGWKGWDEYAPFYDWENARTQGRRDVPFWRRLTSGVGGLVLELGSGTGRLALPLARAGASLVGIDRSAPMLSRAVRGAAALRARRGSRARGQLTLVRGDIRALPFRSGRFRMVLAAYGILQSILRERDLTATLDSVRRVLAPGGTFGVDLVPDVANWHEYRNRIQLRGRAAGGAHLTLIESVRQDRRRRLTTFEQRYVERTAQGVAEHRFELTFRTLPVRQMAKRLEAAGFAVEAVLGDYRGRPWDERADVWIILAKKV